MNLINDFGAFYLIAVIAIAGFVLGLRTITDNHMLLYPIRKLWEEEYKTGKCFFCKPFIMCAPCMCSFWGSFVYFFLLALRFNCSYSSFDFVVLLILWIPAITTASFVVRLLWLIIEILKKQV